MHFLIYGNNLTGVAAAARLRDEGRAWPVRRLLSETQVSLVIHAARWVRATAYSPRPSRRSWISLHILSTASMMDLINSEPARKSAGARFCNRSCARICL